MHSRPVSFGAKSIGSSGENALTRVNRSGSWEVSSLVDAPRDVDAETFCVGIQARLVGSLTLFCGSRLLAEELAQEALVRAISRWSRVGQMTSPEAWTYKTAFNLARSWASRRAIERRASERLASARPPEPPDTAVAVAVRAAVGALPPRQRAAIVARFYAGLSVAEAADALGCAEGTVKALVHKAIGNLRDAGLIDDQEEHEDVRAH
jgi:RNA polymerase sigma factor (sigma-70 family)